MYREVTMLEVKEVLRLWREGVPTKRLAAQLGLDPKTVRRYLRAAAAAGVRADGTAVTDDEVREVLLSLQPVGGRPRGDGWAQCEAQREAIRRWLTDGLRLTKIRKLLVRQGVVMTFPTLYRFARRAQSRSASTDLRWAAACGPNEGADGQNRAI
jgi:Homeodomain-like domain-containing protein